MTNGKYIEIFVASKNEVCTFIFVYTEKGYLYIFTTIWHFNDN